MSLRRAQFRGFLAAVLVLAAGAGCSSGSGDSADRPAPKAAGVTIAHRYGSTTIDEPPKRVVTVGLTDQDPFLALGVVPVGVTDWFGDHPSATWPWAADKLGGATPEIVGDTQGLNFEKIAALVPDLIVGLYAGLTKQQYETLSQIAPTVAQPKQYVDWGIPWDEQTLTVGRVLGREPKAQQLVDRLDERFATVRAKHPEFDGASGLVATPYQGTISVYAPEDVRGRFLAALGFRQPREIAKLAGKEFSADISLERLDLLNVDALVWILGNIEQDRARMEEEVLYRQLPVHRNQREVFVENLSEVGGATSFVTVLSLPILLDQLVPQIAEAMQPGSRG